MIAVGAVCPIRVDEMVEAADGVVGRLPSELGLLGSRIAQQLGKPWVAEVVGCAWDALWNYGTTKGRTYAPVLYWRMRRAVRSAPFVLYVTDGFLQRRYPNCVGVKVACSNVRVHAGDRGAMAMRYRRIRSGWGGGRIRIGLIGTLKNRQKGIQTMFPALRHLRGRFRGIEFRVLGAGDAASWKREAERAGVADIVHFDGILPAGSAVLRWLDQLDLYVHPSLQEGLPRALIEAMSRGLPAVGSTCAGIPELLTEECLVRPGDARGLAQGIDVLLGSKDLALQQARRNWERAKDFDIDVLRARRYEFYEAFAASCARASLDPNVRALAK